LPIPGCALRPADESGAEKPHDGMTTGELKIRSPWLADGYFDAAAAGNRLPEAAGTSAFATDGPGRRWLRTGNIATIDRHGYVRLVDRTKDLVKSGGEWISSQALKARILEHPDIFDTAVTAHPDPNWQERPVAFVAIRPGCRDRRKTEIEAELLAAVTVHFARWQLPDEVLVWATLPKGNTCKMDKDVLRLRATGRRPKALNGAGPLLAASDADWFQPNLANAVLTSKLLEDRSGGIGATALRPIEEGGTSWITC
jgi:fatty-acyl-CoA synthase